jgi:transposase
MPAGRPTDFRPIYCDLVIEALSEGKSLTAFAAEIGVARSTINYWMEHHPTFSEAAKKAKAKCASWWENRAREAAMNGGANGQVTAIIFGLKNMAADDWRDRHDVQHSGQLAVNFNTIYEPDPNA